MNKIGFIGAGSMADSLFSGFIKNKLVTSDDCYISNRQNAERLQYFEKTYGCRTTFSKQEVMNHCNLIFLLMKPKDAKSSLEELAPFVTENHIFVSIIAGLETSSIKQILKKNNPVIRVMPNTSASIGKSATAICTCAETSEEAEQFVIQLFESVGYVAKVDESHMNAITGLSGSGPAFLYYFVEGMLESGLELGLDAQITQELVYQTIMGAAHMLAESKKSPQTLRKEVTSPNGTTEAGIKVLDENHVRESVKACIKRAAERSEELSKEAASFLHI